MSVWDNPEAVTLLTKRWKDGVEARDIAMEIGPGVTRNSVVGKANRLGLGEHPTRQKERVARIAGNKKVREPKRIRIEAKFPYRKAPPVVPESIDPLMLAFEQLNSSTTMTQCRAPYGDDPKTMVYCGHPTLEGGAWCPYHAKLYTPGKIAVKS